MGPASARVLIRRLGRVAAVSSLVVLVGCSESEQPTKGAPASAAPAPNALTAVAPSVEDPPLEWNDAFEAGLGEPRMLRVSDNDYVRGFLFPEDGDRLETRRFRVDRAYTLEFVPFTAGAGAIVEVRVVEGEHESVIHRAYARPRSELEKDFARRAKWVSQPERIDLSPYRGRPIQIVWHFGGARSESDALARIALRPSDPSDAARPDILLVCSDTHRWDHSIGEPGKTLMPRLQELVADSVVYENAYSTASWTLPSIASTFTGLFPRRHVTGLRSRGGTGDALPPPGHMKYDQDLITTHPEALETITEALRRRGYMGAFLVANWFYIGSGLFADGPDFVVSRRRWANAMVAGDAATDNVARGGADTG